MAIIAYTGLPGHGKSYGVVENVIIPALKTKRTVFSNIPMNDDVCLNDFGMTVIPFHIDDIIKNPNWWNDVFQSGAILVIDELWRLWPSGLKATGVREGDKEFLAEHRHRVGDNGFSVEIYFVTQDLSQIAMFARALVESTVRMVKRTNLGLDNRFRVDIYSGAVTGSKPPAAKREREIHGGKFSKEIYKYYKSHTKSQTGDAGDESKTDKRGNILKGLGIKVGIIFCGVLIFFIWVGSGKVKQAYAPKPEKIAAQNVPTAVPVQGEQLQAQPVVEKPKIVKFLADAKNLFISHSIGSNSGLVNYYTIVFSEYEIQMTTDDLMFLGYKIELVNDCLVKVIGADYTGFFMCPKHGKSDGLLATVGAEIVQSKPSNQ